MNGKEFVAGLLEEMGRLFARLGDTETLEAEAENKLISNADTQKNGLFTVSDALIAANLKTLAIGGLKLTSSQLFDLSLLAEIYKENPSLI